jgi:type I restriction enzyme S subunit
MWIEDFRRASRGIADFRQRLYWEHFRQIGVLLPPLDEQIAIANEIQRRANGIEALMAPIRTSVARLREFRSALITAAVNGQIDPEAWRHRDNTDRRLDRIEADMAVEAAE